MGTHQCIRLQAGSRVQGIRVRRILHAVPTRMPLSVCHTDRKEQRENMTWSDFENIILDKRLFLKRVTMTET